MPVIHVCLNVADVDRAVAWYTDQLDFEESWGFEADDTTHRYVADENGFEIQLSETEGVTPEDDGDRWDHLAVHVDDVEAAFDRIDDDGVEQPPAYNETVGVTYAFIRDPDGHVVELVGPVDDE